MVTDHQITIIRTVLIEYAFYWHIDFRTVVQLLPLFKLLKSSCREIWKWRHSLVFIGAPTTFILVGLDTSEHNVSSIESITQGVVGWFKKRTIFSRLFVPPLIR